METNDPARIFGRKQKCEANCLSHFAAERLKIAQVTETSVRGQDPCYCCCNHGCAQNSSASKNHIHYIKSRLPQRVMFFFNAQWHDFPAFVTALVIDAFRAGIPAIKVLVENMLYLIDFAHMVLVNLHNGSKWSIAWVDETQKCYFPNTFFDNDKVDSDTNRAASSLRPRIDINKLPTSEAEEDCYRAIDFRQMKAPFEVEDEFSEDNFDAPELSGFERWHKKLIRLGRNNDNYVGVVNTFLMGLRRIMSSDDVVAVHRYSPIGSTALARLRSFEKQVEITKRQRGNDNVKVAWLGLSKEGIADILRHGFGKSVKISVGSFGIGIYLSPEDCAHHSIGHSDTDCNGLRHMVMCRVILGQMEEVKVGSRQYNSSSDEFDNGVDDRRNPKHYVVWVTKMHTHIHPEFVVSFKLPPSIDGYLASLLARKTDPDVAISKIQRASSPYPLPLMIEKTAGNPAPMTRKELCNSRWMPISLLFIMIQNSISPTAKNLLGINYNNFKCRRVSREDMIQRMKLIVGDKVLMSVLMRFQIPSEADVEKILLSILI